MGPTTTRHATDWLLDDLLARVPQTRCAVILSVDGLLTATSSGLPRDDAEHLAAIAAGFSSLAKGAGDRFRGGPVRQTIVEMDHAYLLVSQAGQGSCLAVLAEPDIDLGVLAYEMTMLATRVGTHLGTPSRPGPDGR
ncbi:dynein regulation protein LC7 [Rhizocola hellebori]|uniref:Dynein regulation protein LC7 n=1 Tax=Rhizocola hellebori TaxID=1392758 RepID=A0A8J3VIX7_9ACTN|nr:roadblock/LC7 domain-containing protein [Rhizocola hellebori]GIH07526.1 dynein regulation protein LC7 [Rhizocola hellebori]